jgi:Domain of unknown function (DUF1707)
MATDPRMRASDADRDRAASALREHHAVGRLTVEEFNERLDGVYAAKTMGDLEHLLSDLPASDVYQLPVPSAKAPPPIRPTGAPPQVTSRSSALWRAAWASWASVSLICFVVWVLAGAHGYPWPVWVAGPWGAMLAARWLAGAVPHHDGHDGSHHHGPDRDRGPGHSRRAFHE